MTLIIPDGFGKVVHSMTLTGDVEPMAVTYGVALVSGDNTAPATLADNLHDAFKACFLSLMSSQYTLQSTEVTWNDTPSTGEQQYLHVEPSAFTATEQPLPQNCAYLINKRSSLTGRRHRGRMYVPGISELNVDGKGIVASGTITTVNTALATWLAKFGPVIVGASAMVILHSTGISGAPAPTPVTQLLVDPVIATQRRRMRR